MSVKRVFAVIVAALVVFGLGFWAHGQFVKPAPVNLAANANAKYPLLARRAFSPTNEPLVNFVQLRQQLTNYYNQEHLKGSIFFQYLPTGVGVNINSDTKQVAASLMKVPTAMDAYKAAEKGKISLDKEITLQESMLSDSYGTLYQKGAGYKLTLGDAIDIMLEKSDNTALAAVGITTFNMLKDTESSLSAVDVPISVNNDRTVEISARSYSTILTCLYYACFNNIHDSQAILDSLSKTAFNNRLLAGISDRGIKVAHKIGVNDNDQSDCGIIYVPNKQYSLCVILDGGDNTTTNGHIAAISKMVYEYVKSK